MVRYRRLANWARFAAPVLALCVWLAPWAHAQEGSVTGRVLDGMTHEPLARVDVQAGDQKTVTGPDGRFSIAAGGAELLVSTVGYRPAHVSVAPGTQVEIDLFPQTLHRTESVDVQGGAFGQEQPLAVSLQGNELKNLASVLADDPLRAAQALPGATAISDFNSQFAVRGAGYDRVGLYLDGVLMHAPFHEVEGQLGSGSLTIFNGDLLEGLNFYASVIPPEYGDATAGAMDVRSREGDRHRVLTRVTASASNAGVLSEGPFGKSGKGSWIVAFRRSYLQYLLSRVSNDTSLAFGFIDGQARLYYDLTSNDQISLSVTAGHSGLNRNSYIPRAGPNTLIFSDYNFTLASFAWRATRQEGFVMTNRISFLRERSNNRNKDSSTLGGDGYGESVWNGDASVGYRGSRLVEFGASARRLRDDGFSYQFVFNPAQIRPLDRFRGAGIRTGAYVQVSRAFGSGRVILSGGTRLDHYDLNRISVVSPYASAAFQATPSTRFQLAWGENAQQPEISQSFSSFGDTTLLPERSIHFLASAEQRLDDRTRLHVEAWQRLDRDLLFRPGVEPRLRADSQNVIFPIFTAPWRNSLRGWSRGIQVMLQRRSANRFSGWIAYAYAKSEARDGILNAHFPMDYDQRHSVQVYGSYRFRPTVEFSVRALYGSGLPVAGWFQGSMTNLYLSNQRNTFRLPAYSRLDFRVNKSWQKKRLRWTLYLEVVNLLNRGNYEAETLNGYNGSTGQAYFGFTKMFPILPSAGLLAEF